jgi:hypothetical protein
MEETTREGFPMSVKSPEPSASAAALPNGEILIALEADDRSSATASAASIRSRLAARFTGCTAKVVVATAGAETSLVDADSPDAARTAPVPPVRSGAIAGRPTMLNAVLREADRSDARAAALLSAGTHDESIDWLGLLLQPILEGGFDYVSPTYRRARLDGMLNTAIVYPLTRALFGRRLRQPTGGEAALSLGLARALLAQPAWHRDPQYAGSDAWLVASVLAGPFRACQAWLGQWPGGAGQTEDASHALARIVGPVFHEMERYADQWQRVEGSEPVPSVGLGGVLDSGPLGVDVGAFEDAFRLGLRELGSLWGLVLPPGTLLALRRAAAAPAGQARVSDALWARIVYDFALAHATRAVERQQLLRSMTPLYLGWVRGFVEGVRELNGDGMEARVEALCGWFEREKSYGIARWRWPDSFNP